MGRMSRDKGARFEREVARVFREAMPSHAEQIQRGRQSAGAWQPDVEVPGLWIEAKVGEPARYPRKALLQAERDCERAGRMWSDVCVAICKVDRRPAMVTLRLVDLLAHHGAKRIGPHGQELVHLLLCDFAGLWAEGRV